MSPLHDERGSITAFVAVIAVAMLAGAGLLHDGAGLLTARREAFDVADQAARAGAQAVDLHRLRTTRQIEPTAAAASAARAYLREAGHRGSVSVSSTAVRVRVSVTYRPEILRIGARRVTATSEARLIRGVSRGET